ncbi:CAP domain-containing protein [Candidatus Formimonas warabiya]|nr:CAP domain-containing protein [Candidatus Formimonas warabiya]
MTEKNHKGVEALFDNIMVLLEFGQQIGLLGMKDSVPSMEYPGSQKLPIYLWANTVAEEHRMVDLVNLERASRGLQLLQVDMRLTKTARLKSKDLINKGYFGHYSPTYGSFSNMIKTHEIIYRYAGENLAGNTSVTDAHFALMNSPGHRANILNPNFTRVGIGVSNGGPYQKIFTQHFIG